MLGIPDLACQLEIAKNVIHQQMLLAEIISFKHKTIARLFKKDWKIIGITNNKIIHLIGYIQPIVTALMKNSGNQLITLSDIKKYWK